MSNCDQPRVPKCTDKLLARLYKRLRRQRSPQRPNEEYLMRENFANRVLLVDDDPSIRELLSSRLEAAGFEARQAEDGIDGLVKLRDELPEVIISDIQMPRMSGIEFVSVVRHRFPSIPVIILSGSSPVELPTQAEPQALVEKEWLQML